jgi:prepilin-type N-terminal cleavage/methylation domain-containing protein
MKTKRSALRDRSGYSMIELLTVLTIVGLLSSMAGPRVGTYLDKVRTQRALDRLVGDLAFARIHAVQQGRRTAVRFLENGSYSVDTLSAAGTWGAVRTVRLRDDFRGVAFAESPAPLEFSSRGLLQNQTGERFVKITRNALRDSIYVSPAGRVYRAF